jgi:hypothetical protein
MAVFSNLKTSKNVKCSDQIFHITARLFAVKDKQIIVTRPELGNLLIGILMKLKLMVQIHPNSQNADAQQCKPSFHLPRATAGISTLPTLIL